GAARKTQCGSAANRIDVLSASTALAVLTSPSRRFRRSKDPGPKSPCECQNGPVLVSPGLGSLVPFYCSCRGGWGGFFHHSHYSGPIGRWWFLPPMPVALIGILRL